MATTLGEYIRESEVFEHSREYFDLMKEAGELELMRIYLDADAYVKENAAYLDDYSYNHICKLFESEDNEPNDDNKSEPLPENKSDEVKDGFAKKAWAAIKKVLAILHTACQAAKKYFQAIYAKLMRLS